MLKSLMLKISYEKNRIRNEIPHLIERTFFNPVYFKTNFLMPIMLKMIANV